MNTKTERKTRELLAVFDAVGLDRNPPAEASTYTSNRDTEGKPLLSQYQLKQLTNTTMGQAFIAAAGDVNE